MAPSSGAAPHLVAHERYRYTSTYYRTCTHDTLSHTRQHSIQCEYYVDAPYAQMRLTSACYLLNMNKRHVLLCAAPL
jgi:hypothetical protein